MRAVPKSCQVAMLDDRASRYLLDPARLAAVRASMLLDTSPEAAFDDLTRAAARFTHAPLAFATLVDERRSFWKSAHGIAPDAARENTVEQSFCQYVVAANEAFVVEDAATNALTCANPSVVAMGVRAWAGFPLRAPGGEVLGSFCVVDIEPRVWTAEELDIVGTLAAAASREISLRAAVRESATAVDRVASLASALQSNLLPPTLPTFAHLDIAACYHPAGMGIDVGGDFYDFFPQDADRLSFILGDVCGKGVVAARVAASARYAAAGAANQGAAPPAALAWLNRVMLSGGDSMFLSAVFGTFHMRPGGCTLRIARGGHAPPIVRRANGTIQTIASTGSLIGIVANFEVAEATLELAPGDLLIVFTDGVDEARRNGVMFGEAELAALIESFDGASAREAASAIERAALAYGGGIAHDDIAILCMRVC